MIQLSDKMWVYPHDLARALPHRNDDPALIEDCIDYLSHRAPEQRGGGASREHETQGQLVAARVKASVVRRRSDSVAELEESLRKAAATINRLLAYVPARVGPIAEERLGEIAVRAADIMADALGDVQVTPLVAAEDNPDTEACHRLSLLMDGKELDADKAATGLMVMHKFLAEELSSEEYRALRVVFVPR